MSTTPIVPTSSTAATTPTSGSPLPSSQSLNNMFVQLLVAELQHQDPTAPVDPSQFVGQLAQFSELSEVTSIYQLLQQSVPASGGTGSGSAGGTAPASGGSTNAVANSAVAAAVSTPVTATTSAAAVSSAAAPLNNFSSPTISALTSKIQGVF